MGNKPFHLFKMKTLSPASMKGSYKGLIWLIFFALLTIGMIIFMFTVFDWYTLIPVVGVTLITLYKQKRP